MKDENPSIGVIICKSKNKTVVKYALRDTSKPVNVASYRLKAKLPEHLKTSPYPSKCGSSLKISRTTRRLSALTISVVS
ncbi:MAG: PDDEXK nuclease domain-containing protein [Simkaniaceae bacterium]|nr:PDDEXK nuclease domain-containing protein [Simkaniaceae bacterium]